MKTVLLMLFLIIITALIIWQTNFYTRLIPYFFNVQIMSTGGAHFQSGTHYAQDTSKTSFKGIGFKGGMTIEEAKERGYLVETTTISIMPENFDRLLQSSSVVFRGSIIENTHSELQVDIIRPFKGSVESPVTINMLRSADEKRCGQSLKPGTEYIFFARDEAHLSTSMSACNEIYDANLKELEAFK